MKAPVICLVMVTYNRYEILMESIKAINCQATPIDHFIIVDNGSTDDTVAKLRMHHPEIELIELPNNLGYAAGLSVGINRVIGKYPQFDFVWLMDDDSHPEKNALSLLLQAKERYPFKGILSLNGFVDTLWRGPIEISNYYDKQKRLKDEDFNLFEVDHALIDAAIIDREVIYKIGTPDERFFMMCEDLDYCKRARANGFKIMVMHKEASIKRLHKGGGGGFTKSNLWRGYYHSRNHLIILKEYFSMKRLLSYFIRQSKYLIFSLRASDRFVRIRLRLLGILHGLLGKMGKTIDPQLFK